MRQFTTPEQTAKLIELGFEKPKNERWMLDVANESTPSIQNAIKRQDYSIGELIEMLPVKIDGTYCNIDRCGQRSWAISYDPMVYCCNCAELVDALYDMIVRLKEEGAV